MTTLLVVGQDSLGGRALSAVPGGASTVAAVDASSSLGRVLRLIRRGTLSLPLVFRMAWADFRRSGPLPARALPRVTSNAELLALLERERPDRVILFRAGLIVTDAVLKRGIPILNIHCATVPEYGGIGSIDRALRDRAYSQHATLHRVTSRIDEGEVLATEPYRLDPRGSYRDNEDAAYDAGIRLLSRVLADPSDLPRRAPS